MKPLLILTILSSCATASLYDHREGFNLNTHSSCNESCLSDIFALATNMMKIRRPLNGFPDLCRSYKSALCRTHREHRCLTRKQIMMDKMDTVELCTLREQELMRQQPCIDIAGPIVWKTCDSICAFSSELGNSSEYKNWIFDDDDKGRNYKSYKQYEYNFGDLCESIGCFSACFASQLNDHCPPAGSIIVDALLRPFSKAASRLNESATPSKTFPRWAPECRFLANSEQLTGLTQGIPRKLSLGEFMDIGLVSSDRLIILVERLIVLLRSSNFSVDPNVQISFYKQMNKEMNKLDKFMDEILERISKVDQDAVEEYMTSYLPRIGENNRRFGIMLSYLKSLNSECECGDQRPNVESTAHSEESFLPLVAESHDTVNAIDKDTVVPDSSSPLTVKKRLRRRIVNAYNISDDRTHIAEVPSADDIGLRADKHQKSGKGGKKGKHVNSVRNGRTSSSSSSSSSSSDSNETSRRGNMIRTNAVIGRDNRVPTVKHGEQLASSLRSIDPSSQGESGELVLENDHASAHHSMNSDDRSEGLPVPVRTKRDVSSEFHPAAGVASIRGSGYDIYSDSVYEEEEERVTDAASSDVRPGDSRLPVNYNE